MSYTKKMNFDHLIGIKTVKSDMSYTQSFIFTIQSNLNSIWILTVLRL